MLLAPHVPGKYRDMDNYTSMLRTSNYQISATHTLSAHVREMANLFIMQFTDCNVAKLAAVSPYPELRQTGAMRTWIATYRVGVLWTLDWTVD